MSLSTLPLSYCTNVHPALQVAEVCSGLREYTAQVRAATGNPLAAGLWLPRTALDELVAGERALQELLAALQAGDLCCYTLNAFPFGNFHGDRVKEQVYLPDWTAPERLQYTQDCARVLSQLLPAGTEGSISTVPLGFKVLAAAQPAFQERCIQQLLQLAVFLDELHDDTGCVIRLAIEPEPLCVLETTAETIAFFEALFQEAGRRGQEAVARRHLGICLDVCHQAVEFEQVGRSVAELREADIRINKVHITCALQLPNPGDHSEARAQLAQFAEPRYLHQTFARLSTGEVRSLPDLTAEFCLNPSGEMAEAMAWRVHFHVPVNAESIGALGTTRDDLREALVEIDALEYAPHLEVETYTWSVLPGEARPPLVQGLSQELIATRALLQNVRQHQEQVHP